MSQMLILHLFDAESYSIAYVPLFSFSFTAFLCPFLSVSGCAGAVLLLRKHGGLSRCRAAAPGPSLLPAALEPGCSVARGILPDQGSWPCHPRWQEDALPPSHQGGPTTSSLLLLLMGTEVASVLATINSAAVEVGCVYPFERVFLFSSEIGVSVFP